MNPLKSLIEVGQSVWLDFIDRELMSSGGLRQLMHADSVRGMTSNPSIFEKAITSSADYDDSLSEILNVTPKIDTKTLYETLVVEDIRSAADVLRQVYDNTGGDDGYVSLEVSPLLAHDVRGTVEEAHRLWNWVDRPNLMIKVPATSAGVAAFESLTASGLNVNVTLMFSLKHYNDIAQAYIRGLSKCEDPSKVSSVASFFISRVDSAIDDQLEANGSEEALSLRGKIAVANAKIAYARFQEVFSDSVFGRLKSRGAKVQRPLWAGTSTKNPCYNDVLYVEELIGPDTVNTLPPATLDAFRDHGHVERTIDQNVSQARKQMASLHELGISFEDTAQILQLQGLAAFVKSFEALLSTLKIRLAASIIAI